jgi:hypothetical protein
MHSAQNNQCLSPSGVCNGDTMCFLYTGIELLNVFGRSSGFQIKLTSGVSEKRYEIYLCEGK